MSQHDDLSQDQLDDLFLEISRALDVAPSRDFSEGVRARIARRRLVVRTTMAGLMVAASLLFVVITQSPGPARSIAVMPVLAPPAVVAPGIAAAGTATPTVLAAGESEVSAGRARRVSRRTPSVEPDRLLVVTNQMALLRDLWAGQDAARVAETELEAPAPLDATDAPFQPLVIEPVRVPPVVIAAGDRLPVEWFPIIRRAFAAPETR